MRFHLVALPHTHLTPDFVVCAFTEKVRRLAIILTGLGHEVFLYAGEMSEAPCAEHIVCISERERVAHVGDRHFVEASFDPMTPAWVAFNSRVVAAIRARALPTDFVLLPGGGAHKPIADALSSMICVEPGIGYSGTFARYRVWESYAWMHACYGAAAGNPGAVDGEWFDAVIPGFVEPEQFPFRSEKDDYYLFVGRMIERKGQHIAAQVCEHIGAPLVLAGPGDPPSYGEYVGEVGPKERGELMAGARALIMPTTYIEPFGNVAVEAQMCGTPVICTDWGAMTETVEQGVTGFRCRTMSEFIEATEKVATLNAPEIRERAVSRYSLEAVAPLYEQYFQRLSSLWGRGWYEVA